MMCSKPKKNKEDFVILVPKEYFMKTNHLI